MAVALYCWLSGFEHGILGTWRVGRQAHARARAMCSVRWPLHSAMPCCPPPLHAHLQEQKLRPWEKIDMPVFFYIDPEFATDPKMRGINTITLRWAHACMAALRCTPCILACLPESRERQWPCSAAAGCAIALNQKSWVHGEKRGGSDLSEAC